MVSKEGQEDRLVGDATVSKCTALAALCERTEVPGLMDLGVANDRSTRAAEEWTALILDVKSAHKRVKIHPSEHGLNLFAVGNTLYGYVVCHFGGRWSAYWWS